MPIKKGGKKKSKFSDMAAKRSLTLREDMQEYAKIVNTLGDRRMSVMFPDGSEKLALIPGRFRKRCWMVVGDIVLISHRDFQDNKVDIIHKYTSNEIHKLSKLGEIPTFFMNSEADQNDSELLGGITIGTEDVEDFDFNSI